MGRWGEFLTKPRNKPTKPLGKPTTQSPSHPLTLSPPHPLTPSQFVRVHPPGLNRQSAPAPPPPPPPPPPPSHPLTVRECPTTWDELQVWFRRAIAADRKLAIAYPPPSQLPPHEIWQQLVGIAKFLSRTGQSATLAKLQEKLDLSDRIIHLGLHALSKIGFQVIHLDWSVQISWHSPLTSSEAPEPTPNEA